MKRHYRALISVLGYPMMTVGLCLILQPSLLDVAIAAGFGALVGAHVLPIPVLVSVRGLLCPDAGASGTVPAFTLRG
jgi:hypothetical protein